jgi:hypothetical protein
VFWIGGGSASGKSTVARRLAARQGLSVYSTDDVMADHARRSSAEECPELHRFMGMGMDERWVTRSPETMIETFHWFRGEAFELILEDLLGLSRKSPVLAEGFRLLPNLVEPLLSERNRAIWLLPSPEFRRAVIETRGASDWGFLARTSDPERALGNLLERDRLFTERLRAETTRLRLPTLDVDVGMTEDDVIARVMDVFQL